MERQWNAYFNWNGHLDIRILGLHFIPKVLKQNMIASKNKIEAKSKEESNN